MSIPDLSSTTGIVNARRIINGPSDKLRSISQVKYPWTREIWKAMVANTWFVEDVSLARDIQEFERLDEGQQLAYMRGLAFLSNLDAIQTDNLTQNVIGWITDPSIQQLIGRQISEEWIHVEAYSTITESVIKDPMAIYDMYRHVPQLAAKNDYITQQSQAVTLDPTDENKVRALVANMILEGIYFYTGFLNFYAIGRASGQVNGTVDMIKYIQRDENTHLKMFQLTYLSLREECPNLFTVKLAQECQQQFRAACELETAWGHYQIEGGVLGLTPAIVTQYVQYLTEQRAAAIGLGGIFPGVRNPVSWVDEYAKINGTQGNFFESKPLTYSQNRPKFGGRDRTAAAKIR